MTLITQANFIEKLNRPNVFHPRTSTVRDNLKNLSFHVYSSQHLIPTPLTKARQNYRSDHTTLPTFIKDEQQYQRKSTRPPYRTSVYHSLLSNATPVDLPVLQSHRSNPKLLTIVRDESIMHFPRHSDPPPTPSDDLMDQRSTETNRTRLTTPHLYTSDGEDGFVPYRLPALRQSTRQRQTDKQHKTFLSTYYQTLYAKY
ncbi:unnamed protein product [Adineta ricciae]|uniref:Uncharacterized protein n=1 Tax=Adineta ricciae TaxID=249248 RepID=A0A815D142_ADIRI|nr:unnamed protein product [Adineta ricciae]CAF1294527.1 unnamed protein product [Adineta ricciae]